MKEADLDHMQVSEESEELIEQEEEIDFEPESESSHEEYLNLGMELGSIKDDAQVESGSDDDDFWADILSSS